MSARSEHRPLFALSLALLISTVGFATSLLSIFILWLVPTWKPSAPQYRRQGSRDDVPQTLAPQPSLPMNPPAILLRKSTASRPASPRLSLESINPRRVSFDLAVSQSKLSTGFTRRGKKAGPFSSYQETVEPSSSSTVSAADSSTSTLVSSNASVTASKRPESYPESGDDSNLESDSSHLSSVSSLHRRSLSLSAHLPNMKNVFKHSKRRSAPPASLDLDSDSLCDFNLTNFRPGTPSLDSPSCVQTPRSARRSTMPLLSSWSTIRQKYGSATPGSATDNLTTPTPKSCKRFSLPAMRSPCTPSSLFFKSEAQSPAPIRRTQPYGPPYYAPIPVSSNACYSPRMKPSRYADSADDDSSSLSSANSGWTEQSESREAHCYGPPPRSARLAGGNWTRTR